MKREQRNHRGSQAGASPTASQRKQLFRLCAKLRKLGIAPWEGVEGLAHTREDYAAHIDRMKQQLTKESNTNDYD